MSSKTNKNSRLIFKRPKRIPSKDRSVPRLI